MVCFLCYFGLIISFRQHEQIAFMANEIKNYQLVEDSIRKASDLMIENGTRDSAGILLERGAKLA
jgi:hypothetical protein